MPAKPPPCRVGQFDGKTVIVTGGGSGIGRTSARRFAAEGAKICVADIDHGSAQLVVEEIQRAGGEAFASQIDVAREADNERMTAETTQRYGGVDIAFLNAGTGGWEMDVLEGNMALFEKVLDVNLKGCFLGLRSVNRVIRAGGAIVVTASTAGAVGLGINPAYSISKHGLIGLVRSAAESLAKKGARINAVCPGGVRTAMTGDRVPDLMTAPDELPPVTFLGPTLPEHVAEVVLFLASNRAMGITGTAVTIDAGLTCSFASFTAK